MVVLVRAAARLCVQPVHALLVPSIIATTFQQHVLPRSTTLHAFRHPPAALHRGLGSSSAPTGDTGKRLDAGAELRPYKTVVPAADRLVVIGDVHGDIDAFRSCLRMANLIDENDKWAGGETVVVQMGDIFDRGDHDLPIQEWVYRLARDAGRTNGALYSIMGNHEVMNALGDHSMATRRAFLPFQDLRPELDVLLGGNWSALDGFPEWARCRLVAMRPGGPVAKLMAAHAVCMKVGDNLFVHAGLLPEHVRGGAATAASAAGGRGGEAVEEVQSAVANAEHEMRKLNSAASSWLLGNRPPPEELLEPEGPVWTRVYSDPDCRDIDQAARAKLEETLRLTGAKRMIVGHTPQRAGINSAADGQVWRVDTGMTAMIGGRPEVLEIKGEEIMILTEHKPIPGSKRVARAPRPAADGEELRRQ